jgi:cytochrome P450
VAAHDAGDGASSSSLSEDELLGNLILLFVAGHETTTNLLGNGLLTLLRHPEALAQLRADPEKLMPGAVDEMLRYESSVNMVGRHAVAPYAIGDTVVPAGDVDLLHDRRGESRPGGVCRAGSVRHHAQPESASGVRAGIHYCVGAPLARMEAEVAFGECFGNDPRLALAEPDHLAGLAQVDQLTWAGDAAASETPGAAWSTQPLRRRAETQ